MAPRVAASRVVVVRAQTGRREALLATTTAGLSVLLSLQAPAAHAGLFDNGAAEDAVSGPSLRAS